MLKLPFSTISVVVYDMHLVFLPLALSMPYLGPVKRYGETFYENS